MQYKDIIREAKSKGYSVTTDGSIVSPSGKLLKLCVDTNGYYKFAIRANGSRHVLNVHRLIAYLKFGELALSRETRHLDNNKLNNSWNNIDIGTHSENMMDKPKEDRVRRAINASSYLRKLTDEQIIQLRKDKNTVPIKNLLQKYGIVKSTLYYNLKQPVAQQDLEHLVWGEGVGGPNPPGLTT